LGFHWKGLKITIDEQAGREASPAGKSDRNAWQRSTRRKRTEPCKKIESGIDDASLEAKTDIARNRSANLVSVRLFDEGRFAKSYMGGLKRARKGRTIVRCGATFYPIARRASNGRRAIQWRSLQKAATDHASRMTAAPYRVFTLRVIFSHVADFPSYGLARPWWHVRDPTAAAGSIRQH